MGIDPALLFRLLVASLLAGAAMGVLYDVIRIGRVMLGMSQYTAAADAPLFCPKFLKPREKSPHRRLSRLVKGGLLIAQDFLFCLTAGVVIALLLFSHNNGEFRGFVPIGVAVGFAAYYFTVGRLVIRASEYVVFAIKTLFLYAVYYLTLPFISLGRFVIKHIGNAIRKARAKKRERKIARFTGTAYKSLLQAAENGFLSQASAKLPNH